MSAISVITSAVKNFQIDQSVMAGGAGSIATVAIGAILVAAGVSVPFLNVPLTMAMVMSAAIPIGHFVTAIVPATKAQTLNATAVKIGVSVEHLKSFIPEMVATYPAQKDKFSGDTAMVSASNINKS